MQRKSRKIRSFLGAMLIAVSSLGDSGMIVAADLAVANENVVLTEQPEAFTKEPIEDERIQYLPQSQPPGVQVKAYAENGVLSDDVTLQVKMNEEASTQYQEAEQELENYAIEYDGFLALDIGFYDIWGNEIEPEDGSVEVKIELERNLLPEDVEYESLAIQHHGSTDTGIYVETVANAGENVQSTAGEVKIEDEVLRATFSVESFSTFTITWGTGSSARRATIHYVDQFGTPIQGTQLSDVTLGTSATITLASSYAGLIPGHTYTEARISSTSGIVIQRLRRSGSNLQYSISSTGSTWVNTPNNADVYLIYERADTGPEEPPIEHIREAAREKYVERQEDGTYDLSLSIAGAAGSLHERAKLDILFVLDVSGSMVWNMNANSGSSNARRNAAGQAISDFTTSITARGDIDPRFALVTFSGSTSGTWNDASTVVNWTANGNQVINAGNTAVPNGGTNYQAGMMQGQSVISQARLDATTAVIFISDGDPTYYYNTNGTTAGSGSAFSQTALDRGIAEATKLTTDYFFTVGVGIASNYQRLRQLNAAVSTTPPFGSSGSTANNYFEGHNEAALKAAFDTIMENVTSVLCTNVIITDILSENVYLTDPTQLIISVLDAGGLEVARGVNTLVFDGATIQADYEPVTRTLRLLFPAEYELESGYTYKIIANIHATEEAYEAYRSAGNQHTDTGDPGTGAHSAMEQGLRTNDLATVTYTFNGEEITSTYLHPVIQLTPGTLVIRKKVEGLSAEALTHLKENLKFVYEFENTQFADGEIFLEDFETPEEGDGEYYTYTIEGLSPGATYKVTEEDANIEGYTLVTTVTGNAQGSIAAGMTSMATFVNAYTQNTVDLEVTKKNKEDEILDGARFKLESDSLEEAIILDGVLGVFTFEDLLPGTYTLTEIKAPDGYTLIAAPILIVITSEGNVTIDGEAYTLENAIITLDVINYEIYELPSVGGIGTYLFTISGVAITGIAILLFINEQRREGGS